jgi:hypothetical protein
MDSMLGLGKDHGAGGATGSLPTIATIHQLLQCLQSANETNHHLLMDLTGLRRHLVREWCIAKPVKNETENEAPTGNSNAPPVQPVEKLVPDTDNASVGSKQEDPLGVSGVVTDLFEPLTLSSCPVILFCHVA